MLLQIFYLFFLKQKVFSPKVQKKFVYKCLLPFFCDKLKKFSVFVFFFSSIFFKQFYISSQGVVQTFICCLLLFFLPLFSLSLFFQNFTFKTSKLFIKWKNLAAFWQLFFALFQFAISTFVQLLLNGNIRSDIVGCCFIHPKLLHYHFFYVKFLVFFDIFFNYPY